MYKLSKEKLNELYSLIFTGDKLNYSYFKLVF